MSVFVCVLFSVKKLTAAGRVALLVLPAGAVPVPVTHPALGDTPSALPGLTQKVVDGETARVAGTWMWQEGPYWQCHVQAMLTTNPILRHVILPWYSHILTTGSSQLECCVNPIPHFFN